MNYQNKEEWVNIAKRILPAKIYETWELREIQEMSFPDMEIKLNEDKLRLYFRHKKAQAEVMVWVNDPKRETFDTLSTVAYNALRNFGVKNKKHALQLFNEGELHPVKLRNYGWKAHEEVCEWLGVTMSRENPQKKELQIYARILSRLEKRLESAPEDFIDEVNEEIQLLKKWKRLIKTHW